MHVFASHLRRLPSFQSNYAESAIYFEEVRAILAVSSPRRFDADDSEFVLNGIFGSRDNPMRLLGAAMKPEHSGYALLAVIVILATWAATTLCRHR